MMILIRSLKKCLVMGVIASAIVSVSSLRIIAAEFLPIYAETIGGPNTTSGGGPVPYISSLSGDGSTIGGTVSLTTVIFDCIANECENAGFVWSVENRQRMALLPVQLPITSINMAVPRRISALSHDGNLALVMSEARHYESSIQNGTTVQVLRDPIVVGEPLLGSDMSSDGSVVVGIVGDEPFLWTASAGLKSFPDLPNDSDFKPATISGNGKTVLLDSNGPRFDDTIFHADHYVTAETVAVWDANLGLRDLEHASGSERSILSSLNYDGSVIVGASLYSDGPGTFPTLSAMQWEGKTPTALPSVDDFDSTIARDVTADGSVIVGVARYERPPDVPWNNADQLEMRTKDQAVLWKNGESFGLSELLANEYGLADQLAGWRLTSANAISDDGMVIAGHGIDPKGNSAAWVAVLRVPEPSSISLAMVSFLMLIASRFRRG